MARKNKNKYPDLRRDLRKEILGVFEKQPGTPLNYKQVAAALGISDSGLRTLINQLLTNEAESGQLKETERGRYLLKEAPSETLTGRIEINRYGKGFVIIEGRDKDLEVQKGDTGTALWGDIVEVSYNPRARRPRAKVVRVVERQRTQFVGILEKSRGQYFVLPTDSRIHHDFFIPKDQLNGATEGQKVVVELQRWERPESSPVAHISKVLGEPGLHHTEMHAIIAEFGLPLEFPEPVEAEARAIPDSISAEEIAQRKDFRQVLTFTIDPADAKDFDDALSFRVLDDGHFEVGVHIADVSHYVQPGTRLDAEALLRATSVYLVDRTIPMLPEHLSNFLCSLRPHEDKLCFAAVFQLDAQARVKSEWFGRTIIRSQRRFAYEEAQQVIETGSGDCAEAITQLNALALKLREKRFAQGSIDFDTTEVKFNLDETGKPTGVYVKEMKAANHLIEEFMLLANRSVAAFVGKKQGQYPFVYRVHDKPDPEKINQLRIFLRHLGYKLPRPTDSENQNVMKELLRRIEGRPEEQIVRQMAIRTMAKAEYSPDNIGHYGLAFDYYTHFTSPIRRYPDVMVHRLLQQYLNASARQAAPRDLELKCRHCSLLEKRAADAERASIKYKQVEYLLAHTGQVLTGLISGITGWGFYVEIEENKCEGMVPVQSLDDDHYEFDEGRYVLRGVRKRKEFHMGDRVQVQVAGGDLQKRTIDFEFIAFA